MPRPARLFISYSHRDARALKKFLVHLSQLVRDGLVEPWHDRMIAPGQEWKRAIDENLLGADIILLLVSADFIHSPYCHDVEMQAAMERHARGEARVVPILVRPCDWDTAPFKELQALPAITKISL